MLLTVYVPKPNTAFIAKIAPKSAIVADPTNTTFQEPLIFTYFEGNKYNAVNLGEFYERLICAAGRLAKNYPTSACQLVSSEDLIAVAQYETDTWSITSVQNEATLTRWAGEPIEKIAGTKLPLGQTTWAAITQVCQNAAPLGGSLGGSSPLKFRTRAGQFITLDLAQKTAMVSNTAITN